jgi:hypothetical protein
MHPERVNRVIMVSSFMTGIVSPFHFHDRIDQFFVRSLRPGSARALLRKQHTILSFLQQVVQTEEGRRLQNDGRAEQARSTYESCAQTSDHPIRRAEIGGTLSATIQNEQLMPEQDRFTNHGTKPARPCQPNHQHTQMNQKDEEVTHPGIVSRPQEPRPSAEFCNSPWTRWSNGARAPDA